MMHTYRQKKSMTKRNLLTPNEALDSHQERILVVDDDATLRMVISEALSACSYDIQDACDVPSAKELIMHNNYDLIISDVVMPGESGVELLSWSKANDVKSSFIIMTGHAELNAIADALNYGASYFLRKPFRPMALIEAVSKILENERLRRQNDELRTKLARYNEQLEKDIKEAKLENQKLYMATLTSLTNAIDARDEYTCKHSSSVADLAQSLARNMGMSETFQSTIRTAGQLHDIGKIAIPEHILLKPAKLTGEEYALIKEHPVQGERILRPIPEFETILPAIRHHHERFDGYGYPDNLVGDDIPLIARIISVCDTWNAMRTNRPYRAIMPFEQSLSIISEERSKQFDPDIANTFIDMIKSTEIPVYQ